MRVGARGVSEDPDVTRASPAGGKAFCPGGVEDARLVRLGAPVDARAECRVTRLYQWLFLLSFRVAATL